MQENARGLKAGMYQTPVIILSSSLIFWPMLTIGLAGIQPKTISHHRIHFA